jgi:hypothetical protein
MNVKENYEKIKDLTEEQIVGKLQEAIRGEDVGFQLPPKGKERDDFMSFVKAKPGSDERLKKLSPESPPEPTSEEDVPPAEPKVESTAETVPPASEPPKSTSDDPWWKTRGYASEEEAQNAFDTIRSTNSQQQELLDRYNAERGKAGQENKTLKARIAELESQAEKSSQAPAEELIPPVMPKISDFEDGIADDNYAEAMNKYSEDMKVFNEKVTENLNAIKELKQTTSKISQFVENTSQSTAQQQHEAAMGNVWKTAEQLQSDYNMPTSVSIKEISDAYHTINDANADFQQKTLAKNFVNSLSDSDRNSYKNIQMALSRFYDFDSGQPQARYSRVEAAIIDAGLDTVFKKAPVASAPPPPQEEERKKIEEINKDDSVSVPNSSSLSANDSSVNALQTKEQLQEKFKELQSEYNTAVKSGKAATEQFENSPKMLELGRCRLALGMGIPQSFKKRYQLA